MKVSWSADELFSCLPYKKTKKKDNEVRMQVI